MNIKTKKIVSSLLCCVLLCGCADAAKSESTEPLPAEEAVITGALTVTEEPDPFIVRGRLRTEAVTDIFDTDAIYSEGVYMIELGSDTVAAEKQPDKQLIPASLTKIMTALVCIESVDDLSLPVECPEICFKEFDGEDDPNFDGASDAGIKPNQQGLTYLDCLYGLMLPSGCEAANVIAYNVCGGDMRAFPDKMNETAKKIGCTNTHFTNAHGLYEKENYSSARDMCLITRYAIENYPQFLKISTAISYEMPPNEMYPDGYIIKHSNRMARPDSEEYYYDGVKGIKTGSINEFFDFDPDSGEWVKTDSCGVRGLVALCEKDGCRYLLATVSSAFYDENGELPEKQYPYLDHKYLFDKALSELSYRQVISKGDVIAEVIVTFGEADSVEAVADGDLSALLPNSLDLDGLLDIKVVSGGTLPAPIEKGDVLGELEIGLNGKNVIIPLVAKNSVAAEEKAAA